MFFLKYLCAIFVALIMMQNHSLSDQKKKKFQISTENQKLLLTFPKTAKNKLEDALEDINNNCCEANFQNQAKVEKIKTTIKKCLNEKCYTYMFPVYNPLKPPLKITALKNIQNLDDLILENQRTKYENMLENVVSKNTNELRSEKLKSEKNINIVKQNLKDLEQENIKLKNTVEKMLSKYQKRISNLKSENEDLKNNFDTAYEMLPKKKKKELDKLLN